MIGKRSSSSSSEREYWIINDQSTKRTEIQSNSIFETNWNRNPMLNYWTICCFCEFCLFVHSFEKWLFYSFFPQQYLSFFFFGIVTSWFYVLYLIRISHFYHFLRDEKLRIEKSGYNSNRIPLKYLLIIETQKKTRVRKK